MADALSLEKYIQEFLLTVKDVVHGTDERFRHWEQEEKELNAKLLKCQDDVDSALRDNFDTKASLTAIKELIKYSNNYLKASKTPHPHLLRDISAYINRILTIFGVDAASAHTGFQSDADERLFDVVKVLADFRTKIRNMAIEEKNKLVLQLCDKIRDEDLPDLGIRLEDGDDSKFIVKLVDPQTLRKEKAERLRVQEEKNRLKEAKRLEREQKEAMNRMPVEEWVKLNFPSSKYSVFEENGLPTHDAEGKELSKGMRKKVLKDYEAQKARFQKYLNSSMNSGKNDEPILVDQTNDK